MSRLPGASEAAPSAVPLPPSAAANSNASLQPAAAQPELTVRALCAGCLLGAALAAANVYTALKTGYIDGGSITASVLGFTAFRALGRPYSMLETNVTQTVAASAAVMSFCAGVAGPIPALERAGHVIPSWALVTWGLALAALGIMVALALRTRLIAVEGLPFPTGTATAEVIVAMSERDSGAMRRARGLLSAALFAALIAWLRDGPLGLLPQSLDVPWTVAGMAAADLSFGLSVSPLMFATGVITGLRAGVSMLLGSAIAWLVLAPFAIKVGAAAASDHGQLIAWLMWPGVALVLSGSLTALALQWRSLFRGVRDVSALLRHRAAPSGSRLGAPSKLGWLAAGVALVAVCLALVIAIAAYVLGVAPWVTALALLLSAALCVVCARGAGETDIAPAGDMGGLTQLIFGSPVNNASSLACGGIATAQASQCAQTLWAFKAGQRLGADPRRQVLAQLLGAVVGALVVVPTYYVVVRAYGLGSEKLPAISVLSWEATAAAVQGGLATTPRYAGVAALIAFIVGSAATLLGTTRLSRYLPSPVAIGIGFLMPIAMSATLCLGAITLAIVAALAPEWTREHAESIAGGAIAGESLFAVILAALIATGVLAG